MGKANRSAPLPDKTQEAEGGFTSSGAGQWTRASARGNAPNFCSGKPKNKRSKSAFAMMIEQEENLAQMRKVLLTVTGERRERLLRHIDAKANFVAKLFKEIASERVR